MDLSSNNHRLPRMEQETVNGIIVTQKYPRLFHTGSYCIQSRDVDAKQIDFERQCATFEEHISIPGAVPKQLIFEFRPPILIEKKCHQDLDDFINKNKKPAHNINLTPIN